MSGAEPDPFAPQAGEDQMADPFAGEDGLSTGDDAFNDGDGDVQDPPVSGDEAAGYVAFGGDDADNDAFAEPAAAPQSEDAAFVPAAPDGAEGDAFTHVQQPQEDAFAGAGNNSDIPVDGDDDDDDAALREFKRKWEAECKEKDAMYDARREEMRQAAAKELADFQQQRDVKVNAKREANRQAEAEFVAQIKAALDVENSWERVLSLVDLNAADPADAKDLSRLRQMLIQLKNTPLNGQTSA